MTEIVDRRCAYCASADGHEDDHVLARQLFPADPRFRDHLPQVPACGRCNRLKQRAEDTVGVLLQFGHSSEASQRVLEDRVPRTLKNNHRLWRSLRSGLRPVSVRRESGIIVDGLGIRLGDRELADIHDWFCLVTRGLYRFETGTPLPKDHSVSLVRPTTRRQCEVLLSMLCRDSQHSHRSFADSEFNYVFAVAKTGPLSGWFYSFKSVDMFAVTMGPNVPGETLRSTTELTWKRPNTDSGQVARSVRGLEA
jgi:hypothetical protein